MFAMFLTAAYLPFAVAFFVMIGLGLIEALGLGWGHIDVGDSAGTDGDFGNWLGWLGIGDDLPLLISLTSLLGCFILVGIVFQQLATVFLGQPINWILASGAALLVGGLLNSFAVVGLARILPGYESTAISPGELVMQRGIILEGTARRNHPARAKVIDHYQQAHYVMVEPHHDAGEIAQGETVLLVRREGTTFFGLQDEKSPLSPL